MPISSFADIGKYNYGDKNSQTLTVKAWDALKAKDYKAVIAYTGECIRLYQNEARRQQKKLKDLPLEDDAFTYWALNDVGTCYYLKGEAYFGLKRYKTAERAYKKVVKSFGYAQFYDPSGFWVKLKDICNKKLITVEAIDSKSK